MKKVEQIPVIDLFAGPGGLAEGFSDFQNLGKNVFSVCLSIEKDLYAYRTLMLRTFFRQFLCKEIPEKYYSYLRKEITLNELFDAYPKEVEMALKQVWRVELGSKALMDEEVDKKIQSVLCGRKEWVLIGGPPCQAYSTVGRSRNKGKKGYVPEKDEKHFLYREYLKIIARHWPPIFIMENVKGLLSAKVNGSGIFERILKDLHAPAKALNGQFFKNCKRYKYRIYSLSKSVSYPAENFQSRFPLNDFLLKSEKYGIPQARHRLILMGIREDYDVLIPKVLQEQNEISVEAVLNDLPKIRSGLSREQDSFDKWEKRIREFVENDLLYGEIVNSHGEMMIKYIEIAISGLYENEKYDRGGEFIPFTKIDQSSWFFDPRLKGVCNHITKAHMITDLHRYLFAACFTKIYKRSPILPEFPRRLWPNHKNAYKAKRSGNFSDRFRVQLASKPATTVMSHISKDGHYYIHYDPSQCRSLTVREAARIQTFPDNYFFEGSRTQQYKQVGNAVPPLLAFQIADVVFDFFQKKFNDF